MQITREGIIRYWASEPVRNYQEGYFCFGQVSFPDLQSLSPKEKKIMRRVLRKHHEYLLEISCDRKLKN
jgi:hypothetical protein